MFLTTSPKKVLKGKVPSTLEVSLFSLQLLPPSTETLATLSLPPRGRFEMLKANRNVIQVKTTRVVDPQERKTPTVPRTAARPVSPVGGFEAQPLEGVSMVKQTVSC